MQQTRPWFEHPVVWLVSIPLLSFFLHIHIFHRPLVGPHVWRQTQTQTVILNFSRGNMDILEPRSNNFNRGTDLQRMEFPLYQWLAACMNRVFGEHLMWSRLLNYLIGLWGILGMYFLLRTQWPDSRVAAMGAWAFAWSPVFHYYTLNPMPDVLALSTMIWAMQAMFRYGKSGGWKDLLLSGAFLSLAAAAKLPYVLAGAIWAWLAFLRIKEGKLRLSAALQHAVLMLCLLVPPALWYAVAIPTWKGNGIVGGALTEGSSLSWYSEVIFGTLTSHLPELLLNYGAVPLFLIGTWQLLRHRSTFQGWNIGLMAFIGYFLFEIPMIGLVHDYYLMPFLPFLFYPVSVGVASLMQWRNPAGVRITLVLLLLLPLLAYIRCMDRWNTDNPRVPAGLFTGADSLRGVIPKGSLVLAGNDPSTHIWLYQLDRKGYTFDAGIQDTSWLSGFCELGVDFLVTDSPDTARVEIREWLGRPLAASRGIRVYRMGH